MKKDWKLPSLKAAQIRTPQEAAIERSLFALDPQARSLGVGRRYYIHTYGCQANERDSETIAGILEAMGFTAASAETDADLILLNTCAVRKNAEDKVIGQLGALKRMKRENPDLIFAVCGCMAQEEDIVDLILKKYHQVDLIFGTHNLHRLPQLLTQAMLSHERTVEIFSKEGEVIENLPVRRFGKHKAWVNIMYGCDKFCTYCIVPYTRGRERSRSPHSIVGEVIDLQRRGYKEVTLLGQNVNSYLFKDATTEVNFPALLETVARTVPGMRIRFATSHPKDMSDKTLEIIARYPNLCKSIHLPVQSGSNSVLKNMNRKYTREWYLERIAAIRRIIPECGISTDVFVGFHNESEEDYRQTLSLMQEVGFDLAYMFKYSERPGTMASKRLPDNVDEETKSRRLQELIDLQTGWSLESNRRDLGKTFEVLVEGVSKKSDTEMFGRTSQNKVVVFPAQGLPIGSLVNVKIKDCTSATLMGELL